MKPTKCIGHGAAVLVFVSSVFAHACEQVVLAAELMAVAVAISVVTEALFHKA